MNPPNTTVIRRVLWTKELDIKIGHVAGLGNHNAMRTHHPGKCKI
jgi:hypothetical protein